MPELGDILAVLRSIISAAAIAVAAYGIGRPLARLFKDDGADRLERGVYSLLQGFPAVGFGFAAIGLGGGLGTISVSLVTLVGLLSASVELACSVACLSSRGGLAAVIRGCAALESKVGFRCVGCTSAAVLAATLIPALAPPTDEVSLTWTLNAPKDALLTGEFSSGDQGSLGLPTLPQTWSLWGLALDGPVTANLVHWQLTILLALASVLLARRWVRPELAWLAGLFVLMSPTTWLPLGSHSDGIAISLAASLLFLVVDDLRRDVRRAVGQVNFAMATLVASLHGAGPAAGDIVGWQHPLLLIALAGLMFGSARKRATVVGIVAVCLVGMLLPSGGRVFLMALPAIAAFGAVGVAMLWQLPASARGAIVGLSACLGLVQVADMSKAALPKAAVALGWQSRESYLLASSGSYRAATIFNQIRQPTQRLYSLNSGCLYFESPTTLWAADSTRGASVAPTRLIQAAHRDGCDYVLLAQCVDKKITGEPSGGASSALVSAGELPQDEKFAKAIEVIPIVEYEFADEYQRTTRYRLWKLQGRRAAASPTFESATSGEEVSSRPRSPAR